MMVAFSLAVYPGEQAVPSGDLAKPEPQHGWKSLIIVGQMLIQNVSKLRMVRHVVLIASIH